jgi:DNA-binding response OmpR family regulator
MAASPLPRNILVLLFGHDPNVMADRCSTLQSAGYDIVVTTTAAEAEQMLASRTADVLLVGSQTGPLTRLRLAEKARACGIAVVHIAYHNHPQAHDDEIYVTRPLGPNDLLSAMNRALRRQRRSTPAD